VSGGHLFTQLSVGHEFACGLTGQDAVFCWGAGGYGKLGDGSETFRQPTPVKASSQVAFVQVSTGAHHACALTSAGKAYCWGHDWNGQVGDGEPFQVSVLTPTAVRTDAVFTRVSAGGYHTCALTAAGAVYCWGRNVEGQLGHGSDVERNPVPVRVLSPGERQEE
jgi:alpha-tubulin suppressor-like RCC1 family protein